MSFRTRCSDAKPRDFLARFGARLPSVSSKLSRRLSARRELEKHNPSRAPAEDAAADVGPRETVRNQRSTAPLRELVRRQSWSYSTVFDLVPQKLGIAFHPSQQFSTSEIKRCPDLFFFSTDLHERYQPFCKDFGPVSCSILYRFVRHVRSKAKHPGMRGRTMVYYTDLDAKNIANAAVLLGAYMMLEHGMTAAAAAKAFEGTPFFPFQPFRDASPLEHEFGLTLEDCLSGLERAVKIGWYSMRSFDASLFEYLEEPCNGDVSLVGEKFVAFRGPKLAAGDDGWTCSPAFYTSLFKRLEVTAVVRLNEPDCYDKREFERDGFAVHDLEFPDCTCPSPALIKQFLDIVDGAQGRVAVHCKAGLGRTGTMIALWMMRRKAFPARDAIAWLRLCRPGSVIGQQQHFLVECENLEWDGNAILSALPALLRRRSSSASTASTRVPSGGSNTSAGEGDAAPLRGVLRASSSRGGDRGRRSAEESEELGKLIEQASRLRDRRLVSIARVQGTK